MKIAIIAICIILVLFIAYLFSVKGVHRKGIERFTHPTRYAHRGLHDGSKAENSLSAFSAAVEKGYGIELDVRLTKDNELVVFHDPCLKRVTGIDEKVIDKTVAQLREIRLSGTEDYVPTFKEVLALVDGKVPLLVEIKQDADEKGVDEKAIEMLKDYKGEYIVESFNPIAIGKVKKGLPKIYRGVLSMNFFMEKAYRKPMYFVLQNLLTDFIAKPDFIAYNHRDYKNFSFKIATKFFKSKAFAWTIRSEEEEKAAFVHGFDAVIFENYIPEN